MKRFYLLLLLMVISTSYLMAQHQGHTCNTYGNADELSKQYPQLKKQSELYDQMVTKALKIAASQSANASGKNTDTYLDTTTVYEVPLVFHIIHTYNEEDNDWISDDRVIGCVEYINHDYNGSYLDTADVVPYFKDKVGDAKIKFVLANKDPEGNCTNGINRIHSFKAISGTNEAKIHQWPQDKYINIWVCHVSDYRKLNTGAYAIQPVTASATPYADGIMTGDYAIYGMNSIGPDAKSTISHELGHILSLHHTWGKTNEPKVTDFCLTTNGTDEVDDTPPTIGQLGNPGCNNPTFLNTREDNCWTENSYDSLTFFNDPDARSNVQNTMNYAFCNRMFTKGQTRRMRSVLQNLSLSTTNGNRENLVTAANHAFTGIDKATPDACTPTADFHANYPFLLESAGSVILRDFSYNANLSGATYKWSTPNSSNTSGTSKNHTTAYADGTGWQTITLETTKGGKTGTTTKEDEVFIQHSTVAGMQGFENEDVNYWWPTFNYSHNDFMWELSDYGAYEGTNCMMYKGFDGRGFPANTSNTASFDVDDMYSEVFDLSNMTSPKLNFYISGASTISNATVINKDALEIQYSVNGGKAWYDIPNGTLRGSRLYTKGTQIAEYYATGFWDYTPVTIDLPATAITSKTLFRFRMRPGNYSNNIFLDNIGVSEFPTATKILGSTDFTVSPNPLTENSNLQITSVDNFTNTHITISDVTGRVIYDQHVNSSSPVHQISKEAFPSAGFYIINLSREGKSSSLKVSVF